MFYANVLYEQQTGVFVYLKYNNINLDHEPISHTFYNNSDKTSILIIPHFFHRLFYRSTRSRFQLKYDTKTHLVSERKLVQTLTVTQQSVFLKKHELLKHMVEIIVTFGQIPI